MTEPVGTNWMKKLMLAFACEGRPVNAAEFSLFWKSCTEEQKAYYKAQVA